MEDSLGVSGTTDWFADMRLAYVHTGTWPSSSPSMTFSTMTAAGLARAGAHVLFFVRSGGVDPVQQVYERTFQEEMPRGLSVIPLRIPEGLNGLFFQRVASILKREHRKNPLAAVFSRNTGFLPWMNRLGSSMGIPFFYETHDFHADLSLRTDLSEKALRRRKKLQKLERKHIPRIGGVVCLHETQLSFYSKAIPGGSYHVAGTGIQRIHRHQGEGDFITYTGSLDSHKGVDDLLRALAASETRPHLVVLGGKSEDELRRFRSKAGELYDGDRVTITGWLNKGEMNRYLMKTRLGAVPLRDTFFNRYLTSPLKLFDCYSHGIPVMVPDLPGLRELVQEGETGLFHTPENTLSMAGTIDRVYSGEVSIEAMRRKVYSFAGTRLWTSRAGKLISIAGGSRGR